MRPLSSTQIRNVLTQYPFLVRIHQQARAETPGVRLRVYFIQQAAGTDLMYRQADNKDLLDFGRPGAQGKQQEYAISITPQGTIGQYMFWPPDPSSNGVYTRDLVTRAQNELSAILWVRREDWYDEQTGKHKDRELSLTLHIKPEGGWAGLLQTADPLVNVHLYDYHLLPGPVQIEPDAIRKAIRQKLDQIVEAFCIHVFRQGLQRIIQEANQLWTAQFGPTTISFIKLAGGLRIWLECEGVQLNLRGGIETSKVVFSSVYGTMQEVTIMVHDLIIFWGSIDEDTRRSAFRIDPRQE